MSPYLSDDQDARLRAKAPAPCRMCAKFWTKVSGVLAEPVAGCRAVEDSTPNGAVLQRVLLRLAEQGSCTEAEPFDDMPLDQTEGVGCASVLTPPAGQ